jgi:hypothetical protein
MKTNGPARIVILSFPLILLRFLHCVSFTVFPSLPQASIVSCFHFHSTGIFDAILNEDFMIHRRAALSHCGDCESSLHSQMRDCGIQIPFTP